MNRRFTLLAIPLLLLWSGCKSHRESSRPILKEPAGVAATAFLKIRAIQPGFEGPVAVRAIIRQADGSYVPGEWMNPSWPRATMLGKAVPPEMLVPVQIGQTEITIGKGPDYLPQTIVTNLSTPGETYTIDIRLQPVLDLYGNGWRAGDMHVHYDHGEYEVARTPQEAFAMCAGGGFNFASFCQEHYGAGRLSRQQMFDVWKPYERSECKLWMGVEEPKNVWGHHAGLLYDPWEVRSALPYHWGMQTVHKQGGVIIPVHPDRIFPERFYNENGVPRYFLYPHNNYYKSYPLSALAGHLIDGWSGVSDEPMTSVLLNSYFKLLELGYKIPLTADSDVTMDRRNNEIKAPGCFMTYFNLNGLPLSRAALSEAVRKGRVMATTGPLVDFSIDEAKSGDTLPADGATRTVRIHANYSFNPWTLGRSNFQNSALCKLQQIDLYRNGQVIKTWSPNTTNAVVTHTINETQTNSYYMVRVLGNEGKWMAAYASPIYFDNQPRLRQPQIFKSLIKGRLYDSVTGNSVTGLVSCVRYGVTHWTIGTDDQGRFQAYVPVDSQLVARDAFNREFTQDFLKQESVYAFSSYLSDNYATNRGASIDPFKNIVREMNWEFPMGMQMGASYVFTNLAGSAVMTNFYIPFSPPPTPGKSNTELVMVIIDKTQAQAGDSINYAVIFRHPLNQTPTEEISIEWKGYDAQAPKMYGKYGTSFNWNNTRSGHTSLGNGFYVRQGTVVLPSWLANPIPSIGGLRLFVTIRGNKILEDLNLMVPIGPTKRQLLVSTPWDGLPASWLETGIGPCNFHRTANFEVRYSDYRELEVQLRLNGEQILLHPHVDTERVADADDAVFYEHLYYDGQCEPQHRNIAFRDPIRPQPPLADFSTVPIEDPPDTTPPVVVAIEPQNNDVVPAGPVPFYYLLDDLGISHPVGATLWINGSRVAQDRLENPIVVNLNPGRYEWQVEGYDASGNRGLSELKTITVADRILPAVTKKGSKLVVSWPADVTGLTLQSTPNLQGPWSTISVLGIITNGLHSVTLDPPAQNVFFRLSN